MSKSNLISIIVGIVLITAVAMQTWYMVGMKNQLDDLKSNHSVSLLNKKEDAPITQLKKPTDNIQKKITPDPSDSFNKPVNPSNKLHSPFNDDFFNTPFNAQTWDPFEEMQRMQRDMDRMFNNSYNRFNHSPDFRHLFKQHITTPKLDVREDEKQYTVIVDLPGTDESNIAVSLDGQILTIKGEQDFINQHEDSNGGTIFKERQSGSFERSITLPEPVQSSGMQTKTENGVLIITIPKA